MQEFKFPQGKFSGWKRDNEIFAGEWCFFAGVAGVQEFRSEEWC
jgi:hypothetical protein